MEGNKHSESNSIGGRLALVTGASGGIGSACALSLAKAGANLALTYCSNESSIKDVARQIADVNPKIRVSTHQLDLENTTAIEHMLKEVISAHGGNIDILISNAGYGKRIQDIVDIPLEEFDRMININLRAPFVLAKGVTEGMSKQRWGRIVFVGSIAAYGAGINGCHYAASKGGQQGMMRNLASRLAQHNISVNEVAPAMVGGTGMLRDANVVPGILDNIPLGRLCTPEEVANVVKMFCTTGFVTGQSLVTAGGLR